MRSRRRTARIATLPRSAAEPAGPPTARRPSSRRVRTPFSPHFETSMPKSRTERSAALGIAPGDDDARKAIAADLDSTVLVEAAAGTGKTRSLVDRMVALVATGRARGDRISAGPLTVRAAPARRPRFRDALGRAGG